MREFKDNLTKKNKLMRSYIGMGYYGTLTPAVIQRCHTHASRSVSVEKISYSQ